MTTAKPTSPLTLVTSFDIGGVKTNRVRERARGRSVKRKRRDPLEGTSPITTVIVSMTLDDHDDLMRRCEEHNLQISSFIRRAIRAYHP